MSLVNAIIGQLRDLQEGVTVHNSEKMPIPEGLERLAVRC